MSKNFSTEQRPTIDVEVEHISSSEVKPKKSMFSNIGEKVEILKNYRNYIYVFNLLF
jgi:hypothetical protein